MLEIRKGAHDEIVFSGRFDASQAGKAEAVLDALTGQVVLDFKDLEYISSMGLGALVKTQKRLLGSGGKIRLVNVNPHIRDVFRYAGLDLIFEIAPAPAP